MTYIAIISTIFFSGYVGLLIAKKYNNRVKFYENIIKFADFLLLNIYHLNENLKTIFSKYIEMGNDKNFQHYEKLKNVRGNDNDYNTLINQIVLQMNIKKSEISDIVDFFKNLGKSNTESQIHLIEGYKSIFKNYYNQAVSDQKQKGSIAFKLSVSIGVVVCVLII